MSTTSEKVYGVVINQVQQLNEGLVDKLDLSAGRNLRLFGGESGIDSIELVNLIVNIEEQIQEEFDVDISLANERAMSRRVSPFATVGLLVDYISEVLEEAGR